MQIYPALKARMGRWNYYLARMSMVELSQNIRYAEEIHGTSLLSQTIQRELIRSRATGSIARYLARHEDRFFGSIVVAVLGGEPRWHPVSLEDDPKFSLLGGDRRLTESFGVLTFDGHEKYYALDGQHRLAAIRTLLDHETDFRPPDGFRDEEVSVIIVTPRQLEESNEFILRYRRLFGHLNRYAKPMSQYDNIIMDEDDAIAIVTRRLLSQHPYFRSYGETQFDSARVKMRSGKSVRSGESYFTTLEFLYELNVRLLLTRDRRNAGWGEKSEPLKIYQSFRPSEEEIEGLEEELTICWNALLHTLPVLHEEGSRMRDHRPPENREEPDESQDCVLFWPTVQIILADIVRSLLDDAMSRTTHSADSAVLTLAEAKRALNPLKNISWDAHKPPWKHILLVQPADESTSWRIANENRKDRIRLMEQIISWQIGLYPLTENEIYGEKGLYTTWHNFLPTTAASEAKYLWEIIESGVQR